MTQDHCIQSFQYNCYGNVMSLKKNKISQPQTRAPTWHLNQWVSKKNIFVLYKAGI